MSRTLKEFRQSVREKYIGTQCAKTKGHKKFNYPNFYLAIKACEEMRLKGSTRATRNPLHVYECGGCGGIHIGHLADGESILMMGGESVNIRELQSK